MTFSAVHSAIIKALPHWTSEVSYYFAPIIFEFLCVGRYLLVLKFAHIVQDSKLKA